MKKILMLTTVALLGTTSLVAAQETTATADAFGLPQVQEDNLLIVLPLVTATADGTVEIRGIAGEQEGQVFGSQPVTAGANENVRISLTQAPNADAVMAVLVIDGQDAAMQEIELSPPGEESSRGGGEEDDDSEGEPGSSSDDDEGNADGDSAAGGGDDEGDGNGSDDAGGGDDGGNDGGGDDNGGNGGGDGGGGDGDGGNG